MIMNKNAIGTGYDSEMEEGIDLYFDSESLVLLRTDAVFFSVSLGFVSVFRSRDCSTLNFFGTEVSGSATFLFFPAFAGFVALLLRAFTF